MTLEYYNRNAEDFQRRTANSSLEHIYDMFLPHLPPGGHILDAGCGPGRDTRAFLQRGFHVTAMDASHAMCELATQSTEQHPLLMEFQQIEFEETFDGIWACASLLHVPNTQIDDVLKRLTRALKTGGVLYAGVKVGDGERVADDGRLFNDYSESSLRRLLARHPSLAVMQLRQSTPVTAQNEHGQVLWLNVTVKPNDSYSMPPLRIGPGMMFRF